MTSILSSFQNLIRIFSGKKIAHFFLALSFWERITAVVIMVLALGGLLFWLGAIYISSTNEVPDRGGEYIEGMVGQPSYVNPVLAIANDVDADIATLVFDGLFVRNEEGLIEPRIASEYLVSEDGKVYTVKLRDGVKWHDGSNLSSADVVFTVQLIQNPAYKSPLRARTLSKVEVSAPDEKTVVFTLDKPYFRFPDALTFGILPKHIWGTISPEKFFLSEGNLMPIGSGPFRYGDLKKDAEGNILWYEVIANDSYFLGRPFLDSIRFRFYLDESVLLSALIRGEIEGMANVSPDDLHAIQTKKSLRLYEFSHPRSFALFLNASKSVPLGYDEVRMAMALSIDRDILVREVIAGKGVIAGSPFLPFMKGYDAEFSAPRYDLGEAERILEEKGWVKGEDGIRMKNGTRIELELVVPDWPSLIKTAELVRESWGKIGIRVNLTVLDFAAVQQEKIRPREYDALLYGELSLIEPDMYSFWHSGERTDPGLNLTSFNEESADAALLKAREALSYDAWNAAYREFQEIFSREVPAVFLYSPAFLSVSTDRLKGNDIHTVSVPSDRFFQAHKWYVKTKRVGKP